MSIASSLYENDFYGWTQQQAQALRQRRFEALDMDNLIEEIESIGRGEIRLLENHLTVLLMDLLQWKFWPERRGLQLEADIMRERRKIVNHLEENAGLNALLTDILDDAYDSSIFMAARETGMPPETFPSRCPWTFEEAMHADIWPEALQTSPTPTSV